MSIYTRPRMLSLRSVQASASGREFGRPWKPWASLMTSLLLQQAMMVCKPCSFHRPMETENIYQVKNFRCEGLINP